MQRRTCVRAGVRSVGFATVVLGFCAAAIVPGAPSAAQTLADRANAAAIRTQPSSGTRFGQPSDYQPAFHLDYFHRGAASDCQVPLPPIGAVSPFPLALRLGAMIS